MMDQYIKATGQWEAWQKERLREAREENSSDQQQ